MKCTIPGQNVKILARALHSLARIGDDLYVDALDDSLIFRTVNSSQSAFAEFVFHHSFFTSYSVDSSSSDLPKCKVTMRSCLSLFKSPHSMDKLIEWCQLRLETDGVQLVFKVRFTGGSTKTYFLPIIESEILQVKLKKTDGSKLVANPKFLSGVVKNFRLNEDEITLAVSRQKATFSNHIGSTSGKNKSVRTELGLLAGEFEMFSINSPVSLTFCLKMLRSILAFAEPAGLPVKFNFEVPGRPIIFSVSNESVYEVNFVVSTLIIVGDAHNQVSQNSNASSTGNLHKLSGIGSEVRGNQDHSMDVEPVPSCSFNQKSVKDRSKENIVFNCNHSNKTSVSRKRLRDSDDELNDCEEDNGESFNKLGAIENGQVINDSSDYKSVITTTATQETAIISNVPDVVESMEISPQNSPEKIVSSVFSRCFNTTFQRRLLPGYNNVLAYDSDGLEDSD